VAEARLLLALGEAERAQSTADDSSMQLLCPDLAAASVQAAVSRGDVVDAADRLDRWTFGGAEPRQEVQHRLWAAVVEFEVGDRGAALHLPQYPEDASAHDLLQARRHQPA